MRRRLRAPLAIVACGLAVTACSGAVSHPATPAKLRRAGGGIPPALLAGLRTVGRGERFHPPATGPVLGPCHAAFGPRVAAHIELFADNHVVLIAAGVGARPPRRVQDARVVQAACFGDVVTLDPTGIVYARAGVGATVGDLFRSWGEPLSPTRLASFAAPAGAHVAVYVDGRLRHLAQPRSR